MPITYEIIRNEKIIFAVGFGVVTADDVISHLDELSKDNAYIAPMKKLVDYRNIETIKISQDEAQHIAQRKSALASNFVGEKCALHHQVI